VGAVADAAPVIAKETPAAPNAKVDFPRFLLELRLACVMVDPPRQRFTKGPASVVTPCAMNRQDVALVPLGRMNEDRGRFWLPVVGARGRAALAVP
jgi:hypothetical protein